MRLVPIYDLGQGLEAGPLDSSIARPLRQTRILVLKTFQTRDSNLRLP